MRWQPRRAPSLLPIVAAALAGCFTAPNPPTPIVTARDLAGTYTGVLQGVRVSELADTEEPTRHVVVDLDLLHEVTIREAGALTLRIESAVLPPIRAFVLGAGPIAIDAEVVRFEGLDLSGDPRFEALEVKQIVFVRHEGEWVFVLQAVRVEVEPQTADEVYVYQYVSYPSRVAGQMSEEEAILYVNAILRLASAA